jgi:predicted transposase YdaD
VACALLVEGAMPPLAQDPHDALFKAAFQSARHVEALLRAVLPAAFCDAIDWSSLARDAETFVESSLHKRIGDLMFRGRIVGSSDAFVAFSVEHQSKAQRRFPLRALRYLVGGWERDVQAQPGAFLPFPVIVLVTNARRGWTAPHTLSELLPPEIRAMSPSVAPVVQLPLTIVDLAHLADDELAAMRLPVFPTLALWALRDGRDKARVLAALPVWAPLLAQLLGDPDARMASQQLLSYFTAVTKGLTLDELHAKLIELAIPAEEGLMSTIAEDLRKEGRREGRSEGRKEGRVEASLQIVRRLLVVRFGVIPAAVEARLTAASAEDLERFAERVLTAATIDAVLEGG